MKKLLLFGALGALLCTSCEKVETPSGSSDPFGGTDPYDVLYPNGDSAHYAQNAWPVFSANTSNERNVLIEDYTGHKCQFCPIAADTAYAIRASNPGRVVVMGIHAGPNGTETFQLENNIFNGIYYNALSETLGQYFGVQWPGSNFIGNPYGAVSRRDNGSGTPMEGPPNWANSTNSILQTNDNKVRLQAASNYYPSTNGLFLHTEVEVVDPALTNELRIVSYLVEDESISPQLTPTDTLFNYSHKDILRESIDGSVWGQELDAEHLDNGKYYFNYIYKVPEAYDNTSSHVVIFVRDAVTEEVYQVIKHEL